MIINNTNEEKSRYNKKRILSYRSDRSDKITRYEFVKSTCRNFKNKNLYFAMIFYNGYIYGKHPWSRYSHSFLNTF